MQRLIDADALTDKVDKYIYRITRASKRKLKVGESAILADIKAHIELSPTIDAEPVKHGKWIYGNDFHWYTANCNKCGYQRRTDIKADRWNQWKYCPNCGARMDEE